MIKSILRNGASVQVSHLLFLNTGRNRNLLEESFFCQLLFVNPMEKGYNTTSGKKPKRRSLSRLFADTDSAFVFQGDLQKREQNSGYRKLSQSDFLRRRHRGELRYVTIWI